MFLKSSQIINIQQELGKFAKLCNEHNYKPSKEELNDIINYILISQHYSMNGTMTESVKSSLTINDLNESILNYMYENFELNLITEARGGDSEGGELTDLVTAGTTLVQGIASAVGLGAAGAGLAGLGIFAYLNFLFKKGKIKQQLTAIDSINTESLNNFQKLVELETQKAKLLGKDEISGVSSYVPAYQ